MKLSILRSIGKFGIACAAVITFCGADWRQFRGNDCDAVAKTGPSTLDKTVWSTPLSGKGISGPIVVGDLAIVTASSGHDQDRLHVIACDTADGKIRWDRQFWATGRTQCHPKMAVATPSPASDGTHIVGFYSSNDLACLDREGKLLWYRGLTYEHPKASNSLGMSSSPIVIDGTVVVQVETDDDSFAMGVDIETGQTRWKLERPHRACWTSPVILHGTAGQDSHTAPPHPDLILLQSSDGLAAVHPKTGKIAWNYPGGASTVSSPAAAAETIYVASHGLTALVVGAADSQLPYRWRRTKVSPGMPSPIYFGDRVYSITGGPILVATDAKTGKLAWRLRLKGTFYASPLAADGKLYVFNDDGYGQIIKLDAQRGSVESERELKESVMGTPALSDGALYIRTQDHLWKLGG